MAVATELHPRLAQPDLPAVALRPEQVRAALIHRDDEVVIDIRHHPFTLAPDAGAVGPTGALVALVEELAPICAALGAQRRHVVLHLQQPAAGRAAVNGLRDRPCPRTT